ncbi:MAG: DUF362 domain-containing protein [Anaerolineales bacterium]
MSNKMSRREFLSSIGLGLGTLAIHQLLAGCKPLNEIADANTAELPTSTPHPSIATSISPTNTSTQPGETETTSPGSPSTSEPTPFPLPNLVVTRGADPEALVRNALAALGGMEKFVPKLGHVIIKPNICVAYHTYEYAATTNPWVVATLVKLCFEAGASKVQVMDFPFGGTAQEAYVRSGIEEQVKAAGGEMVIMPFFRFVKTEIPEGKDLHQTEVFDDILTCDALINVPIAKHHSLTRLTLGMKNLMGIILDRPALHRNLGQRLADLTSLIRPTLTVVDAVRILQRGGPTGGNLDNVQKLDTIIASADIVAADSYAATLFDLKPLDLSFIQSGIDMGLGRADLENLDIEEITISV